MNNGEEYLSMKTLKEKTVKPTPKKKIETPIPASQAREGLAVKTYIEKLEQRINELELIMDNVVNRINKVADRLGL